MEEIVEERIAVQNGFRIVLIRLRLDVIIAGDELPAALDAEAME